MPNPTQGSDDPLAMFADLLVRRIEVVGIGVIVAGAPLRPPSRFPGCDAENGLGTPQRLGAKNSSGARVRGPPRPFSRRVDPASGAGEQVAPLHLSSCRGSTGDARASPVARLTSPSKSAW